MEKYNIFEDYAKDALTRFLSFAVPDEAEEIVKKLKSRYFTITEAMYVDKYELSSVVGDAAARMIKLVAAILSRKVTDSYRFGKFYNNFEIAEYLVAFFMGIPNETICLLLFSDDDAFLGAELIGSGTVNSAEIVTRDIIEVAREYGVKNVAIAHNHPRGTPRPSREDIAITELLRKKLGSAGFTFSGHYIIATKDCVKLGKEDDLSYYKEYADSH